MQKYEWDTRHGYVCTPSIYHLQGDIRLQIQNKNNLTLAFAFISICGVELDCELIKQS